MPSRTPSPSDPAARKGEAAELALVTALVLGLVAILALSGDVLAPRAPGTRGAAVSVAFPTAFLGGVLALLSPCSGAIVPAFFAYSFRTPGRLLRQTYVFFLGLALVFVPIGFASSLLADLVLDHATSIYLAGGGVLVALGVATLAGVDPFAALAPKAARVASAGHAAASGSGSETLRVLVYGVIFGFATSSCTVPLLGAIATLAVGSGFAAVEAMLLFLTFALGIATPLFILAAVFDRYRLAERGILRGRDVEVLGRTMPVHRLVTGLVLVLLGLLFMLTRGTLDLTLQYERFGATERYAEITDAIARGFAAIPSEVGFVLTVAAVVAAGWALVRFARPRRGT